MGFWLLRGALIIGVCFAALSIRPFNLGEISSIALAVLLCLLILALEFSVRRNSFRTLLGGTIGLAFGILAAGLSCVIIGEMEFLSAQTATFSQLLTLILLGYLGLSLGVSNAEFLHLLIFGSAPIENKPRRGKILDTSVIIDGRVRELIEIGFLEGQVLIPEFVLRELQSIADSSDNVKRNRGRRGLDILQRLQKDDEVQVEIIEKDFPEIKEVDVKLIELARELQAKIVTNDFNLNKVAQLRGVRVLNINELANAMKAVVLPGETMNVFILKEGKEYNQGVAYLDDGTMVVVDNARSQIGKTAEVQVTSLLQTTAGKMIFGKYLKPGSKRPGPGDFDQPGEDFKTADSATR